MDLGWGARSEAPSLSELLEAMEDSARALRGEAPTEARGARRLGRLAHAAQFEHADAVATRPADAAPPTDAGEAAPQKDARDDAAAELQAIKEAYAAEVARHEAALAARASAARLRDDSAAALAAAAGEQATLEREYTVRRKTLEMLPEAATAIARLGDMCAASEKRNADLLAEWEAHRAPLAASISATREARARRKARARAMLDEMKRCRADMQQMVLDVRDKDERAKLLEDEYAKLPKHVNRALYTYRIMDIIGSISKQKAEIAKVILDIRTVQKENNKVSEALQRTEALADERVYQDAQAAGRDATGVRAYRALTDLRTHFEAVVRAISETGAAERECRDAAAKHAQLRARVSADNLDRLKGDLDQVRSENAALLAQLRSAK
ncbi:hypothetical protein M885DRAFT_87481 [Pelagophyceae sp. CCMP2097]|nr:hypothetical protein M885DRAFT_87481 [Pelagophyceae sp. CCMP2097]